MTNSLRTAAPVAALTFIAMALAACTEPQIVTVGIAGEETPVVVEESQAHAMAMAEPVPLDEVAAPSGGSFLALSDVHLLPTDTPCPGHHCETSPSFWTATQTQAQTVIAAETPDFIIYLGDMPTHSMESAGTRSGIFARVLDGLAALADGTDIPVLYLPGNNDTLGANAGMGGLNDYCPFTEGGESVFNAVSDPSVWPVVNGAADIIDGSHLADGYYAARLPVGTGFVRVLALNTNIYTHHYTTCGTGAAAAGSVQLYWLITQLDAASTAGEPVLLAMHVPPGLDGYRSHGQTEPGTMWDRDMAYQGTHADYQDWWMQDVLLDVVHHYEPGITGLVAGHTHLNGIRRLHSCDAASTATELLVSVPGISTDHGNAPAFKHITLSPTMEMLDVTAYVAAWDGSNQPDWAATLTYDFRTNYPNAAPAGSTLFEQIESMSADERSQGMLRYLYARQTHSSGGPVPDPGFFTQALDVTCAN